MATSRDPAIHVFYRPEQVLASGGEGNFSKSPQKPRLLLEFLERYGLDRYFVRHGDWPPFNRDDFLLAHTADYVDAFFAGQHPHCTSNSLDWSEQFADSVRYTNASLYHAIEHAVTHPEQVTFSPTSGFHHARPHAGSGFCTFVSRRAKPASNRRMNAGHLAPEIRPMGLLAAVPRKEARCGESTQDGDRAVDTIVKRAEMVPTTDRPNSSGVHRETVSRHVRAARADPSKPAIAPDFTRPGGFEDSIPANAPDRRQSNRRRRLSQRRNRPARPILSPARQGRTCRRQDSRARPPPGRTSSWPNAKRACPPSGFTRI